MAEWITPMYIYDKSLKNGTEVQQCTSCGLVVWDWGAHHRWHQRTDPAVPSAGDARWSTSAWCEKCQAAKKLGTIRDGRQVCFTCGTPFLAASDGPSNDVWADPPDLPPDYIGPADGEVECWTCRGTITVEQSRVDHPHPDGRTAHLHWGPCEQKYKNRQLSVHDVSTPTEMAEIQAAIERSNRELAEYVGPAWTYEEWKVIDENRPSRIPGALRHKGRFVALLGTHSMEVIVAALNAAEEGSTPSAGDATVRLMERVLEALDTIQTECDEGHVEIKDEVRGDVARWCEAARHSQGPDA